MRAKAGESASSKRSAARAAGCAKRARGGHTLFEGVELARVRTRVLERGLPRAQRARVAQCARQRLCGSR